MSAATSPTRRSSPICAGGRACSQYHDIAIAKRLGFEVCWIERRMGQEGSGATPGAQRVEPDHHFATLAELADAVEAAFVDG
jgi:putative hydrolase of the HAD superfamily